MPFVDVESSSLSAMTTFLKHQLEIRVGATWKRAYLKIKKRQAKPILPCRATSRLPR